MKKLFFMATACAMVLAGCSVDSIEEREYASRNIMPQDGTPYELEFMQQVVSEVAGTRAPMTELQPTHLYVEFAPATLEEYDRLLAAPQFECLPFDVFEVPELPQGAAYAVQPPCEGVGKLYALVRSDMTLPAVEYEVLKSYLHAVCGQFGNRGCGAGATDSRTGRGAERALPHPYRGE